MANENIPYKIYLSEDEMPRTWYNVRADMKVKPAPLRNPATGAKQFARVKVPPLLSRFVKLAEGRYLPLEEIISRHLGQLFTGMQVQSYTSFRVTRNEDIEVEEDDAENLLFALERELLRIVREDDLPGSEAPAAWLNYLRGGSARNLRRVAAHNHQDVVTLALLMIRLVEVEAAGEETVAFVEAP